MRNIDKYKTAQERSEAYIEYCDKHIDDKGCSMCPLKDNHICSFFWLDLEAEEVKPLPCPFCKHPQVRVYADENKKRVYCPECGFTMPWRGLDEDVYDEYNRVAKAVINKEENK